MARKKAWKRKRAERQLEQQQGGKRSRRRIHTEEDELQEVEDERRNASYQQPGRGLPLEIIDQILSHCTMSDLTKVALVSKIFRIRSASYLYASFEPRVWPYIVAMNRNLQSKMTSASTYDNEAAFAAANGLQVIKIPRYEIIGVQKVTDFVTDEIMDNLTGIIGRAIKLKSFQIDIKAANAKVQEVWKALQGCPLESLCIREHHFSMQPHAYDVKSSLWDLEGLTCIELRLPWFLIDRNRDSSVKGLCQLLNRCPNLKELSLSLNDHFVTPFNGARSVCNELFRSSIVAQVVKLNLEGFFASNSDVISTFLQGLQKVQSLRLVHGNNYLWESLDFIENDAGAVMPSMVVGKDCLINLPNLLELETGLPNITAIMSQSLPSVIRNVRIYIDPITAASTNDLSCLSLSESIKELHLHFYSPDPSIAAIRAEVALALGQIPPSVQRLAIAFPKVTDFFSWKHEEATLCFFEPLRRLIKLTALVLPWEVIKHGPDSKSASPPPEEAGPFHWATLMAQKLARKCPTLEYIYFQGFDEADSTGDPKWKVKWGEMEDLGDRWTLKVHRGQAVISGEEGSAGQECNKSHTKKGKKAKDCKRCAKNGSVDRSFLLSSKKEGDVEIEVISTSCPCYHCFIGDGGSSDGCDSDSTSDFL